MRFILAALVMFSGAAFAQADGESEAGSINEMQCLQGGCFRDRVDAVFHRPVKSRQAASDTAERLLGDTKGTPPRITPSETDR